MLDTEEQMNRSTRLYVYATQIMCLMDVLFLLPALERKKYFAKNDKVTKTIKTNIVCCGDGPKGSGDGGTPPYTIIKKWGRK